MNTQHTWHDLVRLRLPQASDDECDYVLWNQTCFPFGGAQRVWHQVRLHAYARSVGAMQCELCGRIMDMTESAHPKWPVCRSCDEALRPPEES